MVAFGETSTNSSDKITSSGAAEAAEAAANSEPQFFTGGKYEVEISRKSTHKRMNDTDKVSITENMVPITKTVYLVRHAESDENRRLGSLGRSLKNLTRLSLPEKKDVMASMELLDVQAQIDSDVSEIGNKQINQLGGRLRKDNFVEEMGIQLVAHSPLKRARQTSLGMLGCVTPRSDLTVEEDKSAAGNTAKGVQRVVELPILKERTPLEWLPVNHDAFTKRIAEFEKWLGEQPEEVIAIVGHSQYFKSMLGMSYKFGNCDVWELQFDHSVEMDHEIVKDHVSIANRTERTEKIKAKVEKATSQFRKDDEKRNESTGSDNGESEGEEKATERDDTIKEENIELPRGWKKLTRLYSYDPNME